MERKRKKKQVYVFRRIIALLIFVVLCFVIFASFKKLGRAIDINTNSGHNPSKFIDINDPNLSLEQREAVRILENSSVRQINNRMISQENKVIEEDLSAYRLLKMRDNSMGRGAKQIYLKKQAFLTFDDGPSSKSTEAILDILKDQGVKATFFIIGKNAEAYPDILKRAYNEGHTIAIHTYDHNYKKIYSSPEALAEDIKAADQTLKNILGPSFSTNIYRFPGGSYRKNKESFVEKIQDMGYMYFDWNVLNGDAEGANPSIDYLIDRFNTTRKGYNVVLSLMHDTNAKTNTVDSLEEIISQLKEEGFEFKSLGDV
ncbi:MAG: polysaccharide deacetylase family protein [Bacillota bacterium]|nr:polysaccharide deacetylase family protein [Bacillota bacterium]